MTAPLDHWHDEKRSALLHSVLAEAEKGTRALWGGLRMLLLGGAAGAATFGIGRLLGSA